MVDICIQIHPDRSAGLDLASVRTICEQLTEDRALLRRFAWIDGIDSGRYVNLMFETEFPAELWSVLCQRLYEDAAVGAALRGASMAMCQGARGWDDYRLLHHYDPAVACDDRRTSPD